MSGEHELDDGLYSPLSLRGEAGPSHRRRSTGPDDNHLATRAVDLELSPGRNGHSAALLGNQANNIDSLTLTVHPTMATPASRSTQYPANSLRGDGVTLVFVLFMLVFGGLVLLICVPLSLFFLFLFKEDAARSVEDNKWVFLSWVIYSLLFGAVQVALGLRQKRQPLRARSPMLLATSSWAGIGAYS